jgi:hypothetical protein
MPAIVIYVTRKSQSEFGFDHFVLQGMTEAEAQLLAKAHDVAIVRQNVRQQTRQLLVGAHNQQACQQLLAETLVLPPIAVCIAPRSVPDGKLAFSAYTA